MSRPLPIKVTRRAATQITEAAAWWRRNRPAAPGAIREELERVFALLAAHPRIGVLARNTRLRDVRRVHLARIHYSLYYRVLSGEVEVLAFWHTRRGATPGL